MNLNPYLFKQIVTDEARVVFDAIQPDETRFVGGCVRDLLLEKVSKDIDLATTAEPEVVMHRLEKIGAKVVGTGLAHGTVTAIYKDCVFEITTLRKDIQTDGRHAKVIFTTQFEEDSNRRDFTFNALYMDINGKIYEERGVLEDLKHKKLRFIGEPKKRLQEDYLRILRYFRFFARLNLLESPPEMKTLFKEMKRDIKKLSFERVTDEVFKILACSNPRRAWMEMEELGVLDVLHLGKPDLDALGHCLTLFGGKSSALLRLCCLYHDKSNVYLSKDPHLKFSNAHLKFFRTIFMAVTEPPYYLPTEQQCYRLGKEMFMQALMLEASRTRSQEEREMCLSALLEADGFDVPTFPVKGRDLFPYGFSKGKALGDFLSDLEDWWIENDFPSHDVCMERVVQVVRKDRRRKGRVSA